jgi:uncharacterized protein YndB with AHSA1/START domain
MMPALDAATGFCFRLQQRFNAPRDRVFQAWTDPEVLKRWWCPDGWVPAEMQIDLRAGGAYRIGMQRLAGGAAVYVDGVFLDVRVPERLVYTWRWKNAFKGMPETCVTVEFLERGGQTEVHLAHANLPEIPICLSHRQGWIAAFGRIHTAIEHGAGE